MRLLIVEDEARMAQLLQRGLAEEGHQVDTCRSAEEAREQAEALPYDVILLDWALPGVDGLSLLRSWRERGLRTPILMLTARGTVGERVVGLKAGADDYLVKPFAFEELLARIEALQRRGSPEATHATRVGALTLDVRRRVLMGETAEVPLTGREFTLLSELAARPGEVLTRTELLQRVWGGAFDGPPNIVDVYVGTLRPKLAKLEGPTIQSVRGVGFRLVEAPP